MATDQSILRALQELRDSVVPRETSALDVRSLGPAYAALLFAPPPPRDDDARRAADLRLSLIHI